MENELRICGICKNSLEENDENFASRNDRGKKEFQTNCRACQKLYRKEHYEKNKEKYIIKAKNYKNTFIEWFLEIKKQLKCAKCGENRYWVLDFHHKDPKEKEGSISKMMRECNKEKILNEINKCTILCSNCHRDLHHLEKHAEVV